MYTKKKQRVSFTKEKQKKSIQEGEKKRERERNRKKATRHFFWKMKNFHGTFSQSNEKCLVSVQVKK